MVKLEDIERNIKGVNDEERKGRLTFYLQYITEMIEFSVEELKEAEGDKIFFGERYKNNFEDAEIRKLATEILELAADSKADCLKEIKHYTKLKGIVENHLKHSQCVRR